MCKLADGTDRAVTRINKSFFMLGYVTERRTIWSDAASLKRTLVELQDVSLQSRWNDGFGKLLQEEAEQTDRWCQISLLLQLHLLAAVVALTQPVYSLRVAVNQEEPLQVQLTWWRRQTDRQQLFTRPSSAWPSKERPCLSLRFITNKSWEFGLFLCRYTTFSLVLDSKAAAESNKVTKNIKCNPCIEILSTETLKYIKIRTWKLAGSVKFGASRLYGTAGKILAKVAILKNEKYKAVYFGLLFYFLQKS